MNLFELYNCKLQSSVNWYVSCVIDLWR